MTAEELRERKYQGLRLYHSKIISLTELKALFRITATATTDDYSRKEDQVDAIGTIARIDKIKQLSGTRDYYKQQYIMRNKVKPNLTETRNEAIASFVTNYKTVIPHKWTRYGILVAKNKRKAKPRIGSSAGKWAQTNYIGFEKFNRDFDSLMNALANLAGDKKIVGTRLSQQLNQVRNAVTASVKMPKR